MRHSRPRSNRSAFARAGNAASAAIASTKSLRFIA
jgi:hypothetical protein